MMGGGPSHSNVFIRGLPASLDQLDPTAAVSEFRRHRVMQGAERSKSTGQSKGYGFVKFVNH